MPSFLPLGLGDKRPKGLLSTVKTRKPLYKIAEPIKPGRKKLPRGNEPIEISNNEL